MSLLYNTKTFNDIWSDVDSFKDEFDNSPFSGCIIAPNAVKLYYLLYQKYGNSPIANEDENQFKMKLFSIIFQYGPTWETKLRIQNSLRNLSDEELATGNKMIQNHSFNPGTAPSTSSLEELDTVNEQHASIQKRSKIDGYAMLYGMLEDVTSEFIAKFRICFKQFVSPEKVLAYESED